MTFQSPEALLALLLVPVLVAAYLWVVRTRTLDAEALGTMAAPAAPAAPVASGRRARSLGWRRHAVPALFLAAVVVLLVALARPRATIDLPRRQGTVILAFDVSSSMRAKDLAPSRMVAAQRAARTFVAHEPSEIRIGVVAFSDTANVVQPPTHSRADVLAAIDRLAPRGGTALGRGILTSIGSATGHPITLDARALQQGEQQPGVRFTGSAAIVMLTDGDNTAQLDPRAVAPVAAQAGVRIFPVGIGSPEGAVVDIDGYSVATALDAALLRSVARGSGGTYFAAGDSAALAKVYDHIDLKLTTVGHDTEITALFAAGGLVLLLLAAGLSMRWYGRVI